MSEYMRGAKALKNGAAVALRRNGAVRPLVEEAVGMYAVGMRVTFVRKARTMRRLARLRDQLNAARSAVANAGQQTSTVSALTSSVVR